MRDEKEINAEIERLKSQLPRVRKSGFLGNNCDAIKAQIRVLTRKFRKDDIYREYGDEESDDYADNVFDAAIEACNWANLESHPSLADEWEPLCESGE